jgi:hypothetical protein
MTKLVTKDIATSALATDLLAIESAALAIQKPGNIARVEELVNHLQEAARLVHELHL